MPIIKKPVFKPDFPSMSDLCLFIDDSLYYHIDIDSIYTPVIDNSQKIIEKVTTFAEFHRPWTDQGLVVLYEGKMPFSSPEPFNPIEVTYRSNTNNMILLINKFPDICKIELRIFNNSKGEKEKIRRIKIHKGVEDLVRLFISIKGIRKYSLTT